MGRRTLTMISMFGLTEGKTCRTCRHCTKVWKFYKCDIWNRFFEGRSAASDIRLKNPACGRYEEDEHDT